MKHSLGMQCDIHFEYALVPTSWISELIADMLVFILILNSTDKPEFEDPPIPEHTRLTPPDSGLDHVPLRKSSILNSTEDEGTTAD